MRQTISATFKTLAMTLGLAMAGVTYANEPAAAPAKGGKKK